MCLGMLRLSSCFPGKMAKYFLVLNDARATELHKQRTEFNHNNNPDQRGAKRGPPSALASVSKH